ncbi:unnamed protein product [Kluyveromyces dobzhanskii CBS 2104]|uniref:Hsp90 chaperone protein kinase-targeting subunit n=1 Tax=Kluyveromyces dobzhanskii CBS 2104 TaxID=1427455 RepID=A0A0A8L6Z1_9SACH|nr:unnamed protein product [Kluyveromyces dobzhanskii CBS 2104]
MAIDYSKWDKIEISDDSDVEVHPNVDKRSFIKWKQQSIHEEREKRKVDIANLEFQLEMYKHLNKRVDKLMLSLKNDDLISAETVSKFLNANFDKTEKGSGENVDPDLPPYNEMVLDLFEQLERNAKNDNKDPKDGSVIREELMKHRAKIAAVSKEADEKLKKLYIEKSMHISSEDIHTGFDKGFINAKQEDAPIPDYAKNATATSEVALPKPKIQPIDYKDDFLKLAPETKEFGSIKAGNYAEAKNFLLEHPQIFSEQQKDALMMSAFEHEIAGETEVSYQVIHQSELLGYLLEIYAMKKLPEFNVAELKEVIEMFFERLFSPRSNPMAKKSFLESVQTKYEHVKNRSKVMQEESDNEGEGVETIQLKSLDDSAELQVNLPDFFSSDPNEQHKVQSFNKLPSKMQEAVKSQSLDAINSVFAELQMEEAEAILDIFQEGSIIGINAVLEDEDEFKELQENYQRDQDREDLAIQEIDEENNDERKNEDANTPISSADIVD